MVKCAKRDNKVRSKIRMVIIVSFNILLQKGGEGRKLQVGRNKKKETTEA